MSDQLRVFVPGKPAPQGNKHHVGNGIMVENKTLKPWRESIRAALLDEHNQPRTRFGDAAMAVHIEFLFTRPKSHYRTGRNAHLLRDNAPTWPTSKQLGDADKLARAICDATTSAGVWHDDAQVVWMHVVKRYAAADQTPGCVIHLTVLEEA